MRGIAASTVPIVVHYGATVKHARISLKAASDIERRVGFGHSCLKLNLTLITSTCQDKGFEQLKWADVHIC